MKQGRAFVGAAGFACLLAPAVASAYSGGPPDRFANNPPFNQNCTLCHFSYELNSGDGELQLDGLPAEFQPGQTYPLTVLLSDPGQIRWGFELTVLDDADPFVEGGSLVVTDDLHTQISENVDGTEDYLKHTSEGTYWPIPGAVSWDFDWIAPDLPSVTFYLCGNAADADQSFVGDYIYAITAQVPRGEPPTPVVESTWGRVKSLYSSAR
jgi:hypothetical protein